jgi:hypothetical protein
MQPIKKVQGVKWHPADEPHVISLVCPRLGCGLRQTVATPGVHNCERCGTPMEVAAHDEWKDLKTETQPAA